MNDLIINDQSFETIRTLQHDLPQALLLTGPDGVGLLATAQAIGREMNAVVSVVLPTNKDNGIDIEKGSIRVASIRDLYQQTRTKRSQSQVIIIDLAERMSPASQNAFLKLLEEPSRSTYFILATHRPNDLLVTVRSRTQHVSLQPVSTAQSIDLIEKLGIVDKDKIEKLLFIADGLPAEIVRLVKDAEYFDKRASIMKDAREFLSADTYNKILIINRYRDNRNDTLALLESAMTIARRILSIRPEPSLIKQLDLFISAYERVQSNQNIRLQLTRIVL
ncbi:MAG: AAA family ATPase [Candidatus Saccharimonadales bacterium]